MIAFVLAVLDKLPYTWDAWHIILFELLLEVSIAVLVYAAWMAGVI